MSRRDHQSPSRAKGKGESRPRDKGSGESRQPSAGPSRRRTRIAPHASRPIARSTVIGASRSTNGTEGSLETLDHHRRPSDERLPRGDLLVRARRDRRGDEISASPRSSPKSIAGVSPPTIFPRRSGSSFWPATDRTTPEEETDPSARSDQQRLIGGHRRRNLEHRNRLSAVATGVASASAAMEWNPCHRRARSEHRLPAPASGR